MADLRSNCFLFYIVMTVNFGMMSEGIFVGWSSPSLSQLEKFDSPIPITSDQSSWIASVIGIGNIAAAIFASKLIDILGRRKSLLLAAVPATLSWTITAMARTPQALYVARIFAGLAMGISYMATTIYLAEVTPAKIRGMTCGMMVPSVLLGEIFIFAIGPRLPIHTTAWISLGAPVSFFCFSLLIPESPYFLVQKGKFAEADKTLRRLRGTMDVAEELRTLRTTAELNAAQRGGFIDLVTKPMNLKTLCIALVLSAVQQFSGVLAINAYSQKIFEQVNSNLATDINILPVSLRLVSCCICASLVDRIGRKPLLIFSAGASAMCTMTVALFFTLKVQGYDVQPYSWIPVVAINMYSAVFALGLASLGNVIVGELFSLNVKAVGNCAFRCTEAFYQFCVIKLYQVVADNFGMQYSFWGFSFALSAGILVIVFAVPETKGRTLEEIQENMHKVNTNMHKTKPLIMRTLR